MNPRFLTVPRTSSSGDESSSSIDIDSDIDITSSFDEEGNEIIRMSDDLHLVSADSDEDVLI